MKKFVTKVKDQLTLKLLKAQAVLRSQQGEGFVDTAIKILIARRRSVPLSSPDLYALFGETVLPILKQRITDMFNYGH